jgi:hypothetical protein
MNATMNLELQKTTLAHEILGINDATLISRVWLLLKEYHPPLSLLKTKRRKIGLLDGRANIEFRDNFEMTTEELLSLS